MGMGALATIAIQKPVNLSIVVMDNGHYGETGMQISHSGRGIQLDQVANACGFDWSSKIESMAEVEELRQRIHNHDSLNFAAVKNRYEGSP